MIEGFLLWFSENAVFYNENDQIMHEFITIYNRWHIIVMRLLAAETIVQQTLEAAIAVTVVIPVKQIITHLVHHDSYHQLRHRQHLFNRAYRCARSPLRNALVEMQSEKQRQQK